MIFALVLIPTLAGLAAFLIRPDGPRRGLLMTTAVVQAALTVAAWIVRPAPVFGGWLALDALGLLFLGIISTLFLAAAFYAVGYLRHEEHQVERDFEEGFLFVNAPEAVFTGCMLLFLASMTLVTVSQHFGLLWVAVEATTLASASLIVQNRADFTGEPGCIGDQPSMRCPMYRVRQRRGAAKGSIVTRQSSG